MAGNGGTRRRTGRRWLWIIAGIAAAGAIAAVVGIWHLPARMYTGTTDGAIQARAALQGGLLTAAAALTAVAGGLIALDETRRANAETQRANRDTHVRELYVEAAKLLNDPDNLGVRLAGIYALERIARDSAADQRTVVEVLSAFVREHAKPPTPAPSGRRWIRTTGASAPAPRQQPTTDVQAALTVLGRIPHRHGIPRADLTGADLTGARLEWANLTRARLNGAKLIGARLNGADLIGARLNGANLIGARLNGANLTEAQLDSANLTDSVLDGADLTRARLNGANLTEARLDGADLTSAQLNVNWSDRPVDLTGAWLVDANLTRAELCGANLTRTRLDGANLTDAWLDGANLTRALLGRGANLTRTRLDGADLTDAWLDGADLTDARDLEAGQVAVAAGGDPLTRLPAGVERPASWPPYDPSWSPWGGGF